MKLVLYRKFHISHMIYVQMKCSMGQTLRLNIALWHILEGATK